MKPLYYKCQKVITASLGLALSFTPQANALVIRSGTIYLYPSNTSQLVVYKKRAADSQRNSLKKSPIYNQNAGYDPAGWLLSGPGIDTAATALQRPYYESYGARNFERNYIYYDWGW